MTRHLLSTAELDLPAATELLDTAARLNQALLGREIRKLPTLRGRTVVTMFYEGSTRTRENRLRPEWQRRILLNR